MSYDYDAVPLLPVGEKVNPTSPEGGTYIESDQVGYLFAVDPSDMSKGVRYATSFGYLGAEFNVGTSHRLVHDQTGKSWGWHEVVGIRDHASGIIEGSLVDRQVPHSVFK